MTLNGRIGDPEGDRIERMERADRIAEKVGPDYAPPQCPTCGMRAKEFISGYWICPCDLGRVGR